MHPDRAGRQGAFGLNSERKESIGGGWQFATRKDAGPGAGIERREASYGPAAPDEHSKFCDGLEEDPDEGL